MASKLVLRTAVAVAPEGQSGPIKTLPAGTPYDDIHEGELAQLCPNQHDHPFDGDARDCHFVEVDD